MKTPFYLSWHIPVIFLISSLIFILDLKTRLGIADYIFYFIPVVLTVLQRKSLLSYLTALYCSFLIIMGYFFSPEGNILETAAQMNRAFAVITLWSVAYMAGRIIQTRNDMDDRNWLRTTIADLATKIRGEKDPKEIGVESLNFIASNVQCQVGAIYLRKTEATVLDYLAGHAISQTSSHLPQRVAFGDGLVGQVAQTKTPVTLKSVPADYVKVSSALGETVPSYLQVLPLMADDDVIGVIELGFLERPRDIETEFTQDLASVLAVSLRSALYKATLSELLGQAQQYAEELQSQQEELRVNNEELEQQSKALKEAAAKLESQQAELEQSNQHLEEQTQQLEFQKTNLDEKNRDLVEAQRRLIEKTKDLELSGKYKSEFLANMSHELRTPLNSSLILARLLADNKPRNLTEEQVRYAEIIHSAGTDLLNLINDILDLSKVEAGKLSILPEPVKIAHVIEGLAKTFLGQSKSKGISLETKIHENTPNEIVTDRLRLEQILKNFIANAFKFTEKGTVRIEACLTPEGVAFDIIDTGIGIPEDKLGIIFEAFRQADGTTNRKYGGSGLGLSISRQLARLLGGEIKVKSVPGQGSTFRLMIPQMLTPKEVLEANVNPKLPKHGEATPKSVASPTTSPFQIKFAFDDDRYEIDNFARKILIIEDDENFARILYDLAHEMNFGAIVASTAEEGISVAQTYSPHAIILDVRLPDHNGLMVLDQLKRHPETRHIPVHVVSGQDFARSALEMGAAGFMLKPVKREQLKMAFSDFTKTMQEKVKHVLLVEDDEVQLEHVMRIISDPTIEVDAVKTATDALERLSKATYDCMIMDLSLPDISGDELLTRLSAENSTYSFPPVIVYTARDLLPEEEERLRMHTGSIIIKGARSPERLLSEVTLFLHRVESELPPERQKMLKDLRNREKTLEDRKVLVVDDDVRNVFALTSTLESFGAKIEIARNGKEALDRINQVKDIEIILMDIMMPEMDGYEATRRIRGMEEFKDVPIIALTAKAMKDDQEKCLAAGANDYMAKPVQTDRLLSLIRVWLPTRRRFLD
jgi:CheY-like chemotaxis protein/signal transduction histidine kinase